MSNRKGILFVVSAPAGTGKSTLVEMLQKEFPHVEESVSLTTRKKRPGEVDGVHYHFVGKEEFLNRKEAGEFLESVELYGHYYATSQKLLEEKQEKGKHVFLVIDTQGAKILRQLEVPAVFIFISPPSKEELKKRLVGRLTEDDESLQKRLDVVDQELASRSYYDYNIENNQLLKAYEVLKSIMLAEEHRIRS